MLTNLEPDHLDRHGTFERYAAIKLTLFERQREDDVAVVPRGFGPVPGDGRRVEFAADDPLPAEPRIRGEHNRANAAAATAAARAVGVPDDAIARALASFPGVEHRIEEVGELDGVLFVNDSKATNAAAALRALALVRRSPQARDPRRPRQGGAVRRARRRVRARRPRLPDRGGGRARSPTALRAAGVPSSSGPGRSTARSPRQRRPPMPATSSCSPRRAPRSTSSRASSTAGRSSGASCRSSPGGVRTRVRPRSARAAAPDPRHARARRLRARDGLQRDLRLRHARRGRPDALPRQAGPLRGRRARPPRARLADRLPRVAPARAGAADRRLRRLRGRARRRRRRSTARTGGSSSAPSASSRPSSRSSRVCVWTCAVLARRPRAADDGRADEAGRPRRLRLRRADRDRARPRHDDHALPDGRRDPARLRDPAAALRPRRHLRARRRPARDLDGALPPRPDLQLPRPVEGRRGRGLPERPGDHRDGLRAGSPARASARASRRSTSSPRPTPT